MMAAEEKNLAFVKDLFTVLSEKGYGQELLDALADDVTFNVMGKSPIAGSYHGKENYRKNVLEPLQERIATSPTMDVKRILMDGDMACVQFRSVGGVGKNGADFSMDYCWLLRIENDLIKEIWGYYDTGKMIGLFEGSGRPHAAMVLTPKIESRRVV